jgi:hypothetical protein
VTALCRSAGATNGGRSVSATSVRSSAAGCAGIRFIHQSRLGASCTRMAGSSPASNEPRDRAWSTHAPSSASVAKLVPARSHRPRSGHRRGKLGRVLVKRANRSFAFDTHPRHRCKARIAVISADPEMIRRRWRQDGALEQTHTASVMEGSRRARYNSSTRWEGEAPVKRGPSKKLGADQQPLS